MSLTSSIVTTDHAWLNHPHASILNYNRRDVVATIRAKKALDRVLDTNKQSKFYREVIWPMVAPTMRMQARGLPYDVAAKAKFRRKLRAELAETDAELRRHYARTYQSPDAVNAFIWQVCAWSLPELELEGWFGTKPKPFARRKEPFTKSELAKLMKHTASGFNPNSKDQLRSWLFSPDGLGLRKPAQKQYLTDGGKVSVDQQALNHLLQRRPRSKAEADATKAATPIIHLLMHRARLQKIDQDYLDPEVRYADAQLSRVPGQGTPGPQRQSGPVLLHEVQGGLHTPSISAVAPTGRVYPRIKILGAESGRYAYAEPAIHSWPDEIRHLVAAHPGRKIVGADYSAVEARVFAALVGDVALLNLFEQNRLHPDDKHYDLHINNFCEFFNWTFDRFMEQNSTAQKASRNYAKTIQYGVFQYGGEPSTVRSKVFCPCVKCVAKAPPVLDVTPEMRVASTARWFQRHPRVTFWRAEVSSQLLHTKWLENPFGRRRYFAAPFSREQEREGWNWKIQSTALDIIQRAMVELDAIGCPLILQHHDALYLECPDEDVLRWSAQLKLVMEKPVPELGNMIFPVEVGAGPNWAELH